MSFIKVTSEATDSFLYLNTDHIVGLLSTHIDGTKIILLGENCDIRVKESVNEILILIRCPIGR